MVVLIPILLVAVWMDITTGKIKNQLILVGLIAGFLIQLISHPSAGIPFFFLGTVVPMLILFSLYVIGVFGAGDIKLFSVVGGFLGPMLIFQCFAISIFSAGIYSTILLIKNQNIRATAQNFLAQIPVVYQSKGAVRYQAQSTNRIHFSVFILIGVLFCMGVKV